MKSLSRARLLVTPRTAAHQAPPSMGFSRQEYWSGVPLLKNGGALNTHPHFPGEMHPAQWRCPAAPRAKCRCQSNPCQPLPTPSPQHLSFPPKHQSIPQSLLICCSLFSYAGPILHIAGPFANFRANLNVTSSGRFSFTSALSKAHTFCGSLSLHTSGEESACQRRRWKRCCFDPRVGKIPWRRAWQPTLSILAWRAAHGQRSLAGYGP